MATTGQQFVADLESMVVNAQGRMEALARQSVQQACEEVIQNSPVLTGFFRGNWQPKLNGPPSVQGQQSPSDNTIDADKLSDKSGAEIALVVSQMKSGDTFWLVNNTIYGPRLEYGFTGRDSAGREIHQPGRFFVRKTLQRWAAIVRKSAIDLRMATTR